MNFRIFSLRSLRNLYNWDRLWCLGAAAWRKRHGCKEQRQLQRVIKTWKQEKQPGIQAGLRHQAGLHVADSPEEAWKVPKPCGVLWDNCVSDKCQYKHDTATRTPTTNQPQLHPHPHPGSLFPLYPYNVRVSHRHSGRSSRSFTPECLTRAWLQPQVFHSGLLFHRASCRCSGPLRGPKGTVPRGQSPRAAARTSTATCFSLRWLPPCSVLTHGAAACINAAIPPPPPSCTQDIFTKRWNLLPWPWIWDTLATCLGKQCRRGVSGLTNSDLFKPLQPPGEKAQRACWRLRDHTARHPPAQVTANQLPEARPPRSPQLPPTHA